MESVWWAFKTLYEKGKIYEGEKVLMYDTKFATPVSKAEVTMDNDAYQTVTDPSAFTLFKLADSDEYIMAWTTTPWTLPANVAICVGPRYEYSIIKHNDEYYVMATDLYQSAMAEAEINDYEVVATIKGSEVLMEILPNGVETDSLTG